MIIGGAAVMFQCVNKKVSKVASDMLMLLCDHVDLLLDIHPSMPRKITEVIILMINSLCVF